MGRLNNIFKQKKRQVKNRRAFDIVIEEYKIRKYSPIIKAANIMIDGTSPNPATPSYSDFICDVENTVRKSINSPRLLDGFIRTFIQGEEILDGEQRNRLEQRIGALFISRGIWPVKAYFHTIRRGIYEATKNNTSAVV